MSKDLDKLSSEMRKIKPSKHARQTAMDAAMGAFQQEFSPETDTRSEKISGTTQGFESELRPTGQITRMDRVQTFGRQTMAKFNSLFNFKPQTMMMAGSCTAALIAGLIIVPNMDGFTGDIPVANTEPVEAVAEKNSPESQNSEVFVELKRADAVFDDEEGKSSSPSEVSDKEASVKADVDTVVVTGQRLALEEHAKQNPSALSTVTAENLGGQPDQSLAEAADLLSAEPSLPKSEPSAQRGIISVNRLLSDINSNAAKVEAGNRQREAEFAQRANAKSSLLGRLQSSVPEGHESVLVESTLPTKIGGLTLEQSAPEFNTVTEHVFVQEASTELVTIPAQYETVTETVVVKEASTELVVTPAEYEWVDGDVEGSVVEYEVTPAEFETVSETVVVQEASTELVTIPPVYETVMETIVVQPEYVATDGVIIPPVTKQVPRRVVKTPASTQERTIPAVTKTETRRVIKTPASTVERVVPYEKKGGKTRVPVKAASVIEKDVPAVTKEVLRKRLCPLSLLMSTHHLTHSCGRLFIADNCRHAVPFVLRK